MGQIIGKLTANAEAKQIGEKTVITFTIATNTSYMKGDEVVKIVDYSEAEYWVKNPNPKLMELLTQGRLVVAEGRIVPNAYLLKNPDGSLNVDENGQPQCKGVVKVIIEKLTI